MKWRSALEFLCDCRLLIKLKGNFYKTTILLVILYGTGYWVIEK